jgi:hypothetical protein
MPTHAKKTSWLLAGGLACLLHPTLLMAQQSPATPSDSSAFGTPAATSPAPSASSAQTPSAPAASPTPPANGAAPDSSTSDALKYLYDHKAQDGSIAKQGMDASNQAKTDEAAQDAMGNKQIEDPEERARFERYLGTDEVPQSQLKNYSDDMDNVIALLHAKKTTLAWQQLYKLAKYQPIDAGVSWELANRIESIWDADQTSSDIAKQNADLKKEADDANRNADMMSDDLKQKDIEYQRQLQNGLKHDGGNSNSGGNSSSGGNSGSNVAGDTGVSTAPPPDSIQGKLELTAEYLNSLEAQSKIKLNELKVEKLFDQAKSDFADYITTLYKSGRYRHVLIAADFWRQIFDQGDYPVSMAQQVNASLEITREVDTTISVFNRSLDQKDVSDATDRLQEAFMLSENHPAVLGLPLARKKPVQTFLRELSRMQHMIEARDFTELEPLLSEIKQTAPDFDDIKAMAMVNSVKLESQLKLGQAKLAAQQGDLKAAMEDFQSAAEAWPGNPDLKDKALSFFKSQDVQTQSLDEFDRLVAENNYRAIYDKQLAFAPAMKDDAKRQAQLKAALEKVKIAETAIEKATLMQSNGDVDGAWETVQLAIKDLPDDLKLNSMRGDLAGKGAEFVAAISKAQDAESRQELGFSLSWYAVAQRDYPASQIANQAIDRISKAILVKAGL